MKEIRKRAMMPIVIVSLVLACLNACNTDEFDMDKLSDDIILEPEIVVPIMRSDWKLIDLVDQESADVKTDEDGLIRISYVEESLVDLQVNDLFKVTDGQELLNGTVVFDVLEVQDLREKSAVTLKELIDNVGGALSILDGADGSTVPFPSFAANGNLSEKSFSLETMIKSATFSQGTLALSLRNNLPVAIHPVYDIFLSKGMSADARMDFGQIQPGETVIRNLDLTGRTVGEKINFRLVHISTPGSLTPVLINHNDEIDMTMNLTEAKISSGLLTVSDDLKLQKKEQVTVAFDDAVKLQTLELKNGKLNYRIYSHFENDVNIRVILPTAKINDEVFYKDVLVASKTVIEGAWDLSELDIDLGTVTEEPFNKMPIEYEARIAGDVDQYAFNSSEEVSITLTLTEPEIGYAEGNFGQQIIEIDEDQFNIDMDFWDEIDGGFTLTDPQIKFKITNSTGVPGLLDLNLTASNAEGKTVDFNPLPQLIPYPSTPDVSPTEGEVIYNKMNSNIVEVISLPPSGDIVYGGKILVNPNNEAGMTNFMSSESSIKMDMEIDLPLVVKTGNLSVQDTIDITGDDYEKVKKAELIINYENEIPLDIHVQIDMLDESDLILDQVISNVLPTSEVDQDGNMTAAVSGTTRIVLTESQLIHLQKSESLGLTVRVNSPDEGAVPARLLADYTLKLNLGMAVKLDFAN